METMKRPKANMAPMRHDTTKSEKNMASPPMTKAVKTSCARVKKKAAFFSFFFKMAFLTSSSVKLMESV